MLTFSVNKQIITRTDSNVAIADSVDYLTATFSFSEEWENCSKTVIFRFCHTVKSLILENDSCIVPWEVIKAGGFEVSVIGVYGSVLITTNILNVPCGVSGYAEGEAPEPPTPTQWAQIMSILAHLQGGATNEVVAKRSNADYDFKFVENGGGGGSSVEWTQLLSEGTKIATITIDDEPYDVYAPTPFSGDYNDLTNQPSIPSTLAELDSDSTHRTVSDADISAWNGKSVVACTQVLSTGTLIGTITINGVSVNLYAPNGGGGGSSTWGQITGTLSNQTDLQTALNAKANLPSSETVTVSEGTASKQLTAHKLCVFDGAATALTITFPASVNASDEFNFVFTTGANGCTLTLPNTVEWDGSTPVFANSTMYEVSIDGLGIAFISQGVSVT